MKTNYAIFDQSGSFVRFESIDPANIPNIPLADDGLPRAVPAVDAPSLAPGQSLAFSRSGWVVTDGDLPVPSPLPAWRIRTVLRRHGLLDSVEAMIAQLPEPPRYVVEEQMKSSNFERGHPIIEQFGAALGLTSEQLDDLFREAEALV